MPGSATGDCQSRTRRTSLSLLFVACSGNDAAEKLAKITSNMNAQIIAAVPSVLMLNSTVTLLTLLMSVACLCQHNPREHGWGDSMKNSFK